jgi:hypothetical protein
MILVMCWATFLRHARHDTGHDGGDSHYNAVDEDNAFSNISSKSKAPYKPPPSASSPTAPPHERDAEPIVDDMIQQCGSCNSINFCHALPDGSFVCLTLRLTPATCNFPSRRIAASWPLRISFASN